MSPGAQVLYMYKYTRFVLTENIQKLPRISTRGFKYNCHILERLNLAYKFRPNFGVIVYLP